MKQVMLTFLAATVLASCASTPSNRAANVKEADPGTVSRCQLLGTVIGSSLIGGVVVKTGGTNAMVDAREQAADMGATHIVFMAVDSGNQYSTGKATARAYRCGR